MSSGIQQGIASKYYSMAEDARTPDQINQVRQLLAKTIQSGGLPAYEGIPIVEQLNGKYQTALQQQAMAGQTKAGLISPTSQPMAQEILAQAEQPDEEVDSGIDELASNLPTEEYAEGGIVGFATGGGWTASDAYREGMERIFGKKDSGASGASTSTSKGGVTIPSMTGAGRPSVPIIGAPPAMIGGIPSIETLGPRPTANQQGIGSLISNFDPNKGTNRVTLPKGALAAGEYTNTMGSGPDASYLMELLQDQKLNPNDETIQKEIDKIVNKKQINPLNKKEIPVGQQTLEYVQSQMDAGKKPPVAATRRPDALPDNVQAVLDQYKTSKKVGDTAISNKPNAPAAPAKAPTAPVVKEEMGPPRDLMAAEAPVVDTTPKEDVISKYEKMLTQPPEQRKKERDLDFYTRLFQAGVGVASGSSRNALENLKEAQPAIAGFASDIAKQREDDRNRIKDLASLGLKREEFALEVKKLGISEKQANAIAKHYDDYFKLGQEKNRITEQHYKDVAKNYANAAGNLGARLESTQGIAQDRNIAGLIKSYAAMPSNYGKSPAELRAMALQALGLSGGAGGAGGPTTLSYADFAKGLK